MKKCLLLLPLFFFATQASAATPTAVASGITTGASANTTATLSVTVPSGNQNNVMLVFVANRCGGRTFSATYNGVGMTLGNSPAAVFAFQSAWFYLAAPTVGTANAVVSWTGGNCTDTGIAAVVLKDAFQGAADVHTYLGQNTAASITRSVTTTQADELGVMFVAEDSSGVSSAWTEVGSQTRQVNAAGNFTAASAYGEIATLPFTSAGSNSMGLTWTGARAADEMLVAIKYQAPSAVSTIIFGILTFFGW